jgi:hypothetical protein
MPPISLQPAMACFALNSRCAHAADLACQPRHGSRRLQHPLSCFRLSCAPHDSPRSCACCCWAHARRRPRTCGGSCRRCWRTIEVVAPLDEVQEASDEAEDASDSQGCPSPPCAVLRGMCEEGAGGGGMMLVAYRPRRVVRRRARVYRRRRGVCVLHASWDCRACAADSSV